MSLSSTPKSFVFKLPLPASAALVQDTRRSSNGVPNYRGFIQLCVGGKNGTQAVFDVHEYLITARSPFFKKAMSGDWKEAKDRRVHFPEDEPNIFQLYVHLLYTGTLAVISDSALNDYFRIHEHTCLAKIYVLAEKLQDADAKNKIVEAMLVSSACYVPGSPAVSVIYKSTPTGSPMRRLIVDLYTYRATKITITGICDSVIPGVWPNEFMAELTLNLLDKRAIPADPTRTGDASIYLESKTKQGP